MYNFQKIIGLKVLAIKSYSTKDKKEPNIILFNDGKTFIKLDEQNYYDYHDCASYARVIEIMQDKGYWENYNKYDDANQDI